ncbi:MAG: [FeFe] hydrogenase H-cluster maturation GTPase HydF [Alphaproteobacteria bacterium]|nr:[FeFe] hydrogenase H-cluster maturation GTPase HydF [Alphaproteobacteria bacterium]
MEKKLPHQGLRPIISLIGDTNAGKSLLLNKIVEQDVSIVSDILGTTTDVVTKAYELIPFGAVSFCDTAGLNDETSLGVKRIKATKKTIYKSNLVLVVIGKEAPSKALLDEINELKEKNIPYIVVYNFLDENNCCGNSDGVHVSAKTGENIDELRAIIAEKLKKECKDIPLISDKIKEKDVVILVCPIDEAAPKGRLIMPQVQVLRELLDYNAIGIVVKENELKDAISNLNKKPKFVISDSSIIKNVAKIVDEDIRLTTFSTLFARYKGDFKLMIDGANKLDTLKDGDKILIAEGCAHRVTCNDIGRVKIPNLIKQYTKKDVLFDVVSGADFKENLEDYALVVHCGGCMLNRMEIIRRMNECSRNGVSITNYGMLISKTQGVFDRVIKDLI